MAQQQQQTQTLTIDSPFGPKAIEAPAGWDFNSTDAIVWNKLLWLTRENKGFKTKRDHLINEGKIDALSNILANSLGMAGFYWMMSAREFVAAES